MFLRFTTTLIDDTSHKPKGVFTTAFELLKSGDLDSTERGLLKELLDWFEENLPSPPDNFYASRAIFWFKSSAKENISQIWKMIYVLRAHGYHIEVYKCSTLGNICYRDKFQVAAYPSEKDGKITVQ